MASEDSIPSSKLVKDSKLSLGLSDKDLHFQCQSCHKLITTHKSFILTDNDAKDLTESVNSLMQHTDDSIANDTTQTSEHTDFCTDPTIERRCVPHDLPPPDTSVADLASSPQILDIAQTANTIIPLDVLFDILSRQTGIDHPMCEDCARTLIENLQKELLQAREDVKAYEEYYSALSEYEGGADSNELDSNTSKLMTELEMYRQEEAELSRQLEEMESERRAIEEEMKIEKIKEGELESKEKEYWKEFNDFQKQLLQYHDEELSVENQLHYVTGQLDKLKKTNMLNSAFHIWHNGHFGTINSFRLGRLPSVPVDWNEINAAMGQAVLLFHCLSRKIHISFERYRVVPYGSHSYVEELATKKELPLFSNSSLRLFSDTKFDQGLVAFLDCVGQFKSSLEYQDEKLSLPYKIDKDKIGNEESGFYCIRRQLNSDEHWTKALKFMLTNLRWGLTIVAAAPEL